jgi:hypothetical protein
VRLPTWRVWLRLIRFCGLVLFILQFILQRLGVVGFRRLTGSSALTGPGLKR